MVNTSDRPITVDGVRLDTLAWNVTSIQRATPGRRAMDTEVPGRDGALPSLNDTLEPGSLGLSMFIMGTDANGAVPAPGRRDTLRANLDELVHLFGKRHGLLEVRQTVAAGVERRAWAKVTDSIQPNLNETGSSGEFTVGLTLPYATWEDVNTADWSGIAGQASGAWQEVTTLAGATERTQDAVVLVTGPVTNARITDASGAYVELLHPLPAGQFWRVNVATWATRYGPGLGLGSADTTGTDGQALTRFGGLASSAAFLPLTPMRDTGARRVKVALSGGDMSASTRIQIRARRKFAL